MFCEQIETEAEHICVQWNLRLALKHFIEQNVFIIILSWMKMKVHFNNALGTNSGYSKGLFTHHKITGKVDLFAGL